MALNELIQFLLWGISVINFSVEGLYDPRLRARRLRRRLRRPHQRAAIECDRAPGAAGAHQPVASRCVRLRGQHRRRRRHSDSDARSLPAQGSGAPRHHAAAGGRVRRGSDFPAARGSAAARGSRPCSSRWSPSRDCACSAGATCRPTRRRLVPQPRPRRAGRSSRSSSASGRANGPRGRSSTARPASPPTSSASCTSFASASSTPWTRSRCPRSKSFYVVSLSSTTLIYKGMLTADQIETMFPDLNDTRHRIGARAGAPAFQHQYVPVLAARASVPVRRAQRRDQHAARQHQLDEGARGAVPVRGVWRRPEEDHCRSSAKAAATPRRSTTCSSSS